MGRKNNKKKKERVIIQFTDDIAVLQRKNNASGYDVVACIEDSITINSLERVLIPVGIKMALPSNMECQVRPRSGIARDFGVTVLNTPGTVDEDYRGEVGVILVNLSNNPFTIHRGDKIAQLVFNRVKHPYLVDGVVNEDTVRGANGFGSSGLKADVSDKDDVGYEVEDWDLLE